MSYTEDIDTIEEEIETVLDQLEDVEGGDAVELRPSLNVEADRVYGATVAELEEPESMEDPSLWQTVRLLEKYANLEQYSQIPVVDGELFQFALAFEVDDGITENGYEQMVENMVEEGEWKRADDTSFSGKAKKLRGNAFRKAIGAGSLTHHYNLQGDTNNIFGLDYIEGGDGSQYITMTSVGWKGHEKVLNEGRKVAEYLDGLEDTEAEEEETIPILVDQK